MSFRAFVAEERKLLRMRNAAAATVSRAPFKSLINALRHIGRANQNIRRKFITPSSVNDLQKVSPNVLLRMRL
jgi:hypothetical protein